MTSSVETPQHDIEAKNNQENLRGDLEDLIQRQQLDTLSEDVIKSKLENIYGHISSFPVEKDPDKYTDQEKSLMEGVFFSAGALLYKQIRNDLLLPENSRKSFATPKAFFEGLPRPINSPGEAHVIMLMEKVLQDKSSHPKLYNLFYKDWGKAVQYLEGRAEEHAKASSQEAQQALQKEKTNPTEEQQSWIDKTMDLIKKNPGQALGIAGLGLVGAIFLGKFLFAGKGERSWTDLLLGGGLAAGAAALFTGGDFTKLFDMFKNTPDAPKKDKETNDGIEKVPLSEAWKNYEKDMTKIVYPLKAFYLQNEGGINTVLGLSALFTSVGHEAVIAGSKLALGKTAALMTLPFTVVKGFSLNKLFFVLSAYGIANMSAESLKNIKVPKDKENLKKEIRKKVDEISKKAKSHEEEIHLSDKDIDTVASIMLGEEDVSQYIDNNNILNFVKGGLEKASLSPEELILSKNKSGMQTLLTKLEGFELDSGSSFPASKKIIEDVIKKLSSKKKLDKYDIFQLQNTLNGEGTGVEIMTKGDYLWAMLPNPETPTIPTPIRIGINYSLRPGEAEKAAKMFHTSSNIKENWGYIVTRPFEEGREYLGKILDSLGGEKTFHENIESGKWAIARIGTELVVVGATEYYVLGPAKLAGTIMKGIFSGYTHSDFDVVETGITVANGMLPVAIYRLSANSIKQFRNIAGSKSIKEFTRNVFQSIGKVFGTTLLETVTYPITGAKALAGKVAFGSRYIAPLLVGDFIPFTTGAKGLRSKMFSHINEVQRKVFSDARSPFYNETIGRLYGKLGEANEAYSLLAEAKFATDKKDLIQQAEKLLGGSSGAKIDIFGHGDIDFHTADLDDLIQKVGEYIAKQSKDIRLLRATLYARNIALLKGNTPLAAAKHAELQEKFPSIFKEIDFDDINVAELRKLRTRNLTKGGIYASIAAIGLLAMGSAYAATKKNEKEQEFGTPHKPEAEKKKPTDRLDNPEYVDRRASVILKHFNDIRDVYVDRMSQINPDTLRTMDNHSMIALMDNIMEDHEADTENLQQYIAANKDIILAYLKLHPQSEGVIGHSFKLTRTPDKKNLIFEYATKDDLKLLTYDTLDAINTALTIEKTIKLVPGTDSVAENQYTQLGTQLTLETLPITGTILDANRLIKSIERSQLKESGKNTFFLAISILSEIPLLEELKIFKGVRISEKLQKMERIFKLMKTYGHKIIAGGMAVGLMNGVWMSMKPDRSHKVTI